MADEHEQHLSGKCILVVDDEEDYCILLRLILEANGAQVFEATSATEAAQVLATTSIDLLVSDIGLPRRDGYALIRQIRASLEGALVPAVALTARRSDLDRNRALAAGFDVHLPKPLDAQALVATIAQLIRPSRP